MATRKSKSAALLSLSISWGFVAINQANAADVIWVGAGLTGNWTDSANWFQFNGPVNGNADNVTIGGFAGRTTSIVNQSYLIRSINFSSTTGNEYASTVNASNASILSISDGIYNQTSRAQVVNAPVRLTSAVQFRNRAPDGAQSFGSLSIGSVALNGNLLDLYPSDNGITISGAITGSGDIRLNDAGTATLAGSSSWIGNLYIAKGKLVANAGANLGSLSNAVLFNPVDATSFPTLVRGLSGTISIPMTFNDYEGRIETPTGVTLTLAGAVTCNAQGAFAKTGAGTVVLTAPMVGGGATTVREGTLRISGTNAAPNGALTVLSGSTLSLDANVVQQCTSLNGLGTIQLGSAAQLHVGGESVGSPDGTNEGTFGGSISGTDALLIKRGRGTLRLTGASSFIGIIDVQGGALVVDNDVNGSAGTSSLLVTVKAGSRLAGSAAAGGLVYVDADGQLAPSSPLTADVGIGSLTTGTLTLFGGSRLSIEFNADSMDHVDVSENAAIAGNLELVPFGTGPSPAIGFTRSVVTTDTGITGAFASIAGVSLSPTASIAITYADNRVIATVADPGDVTLDRQTNFDDLLVLAANYNSPNLTTWSLGDLTGDGATNFDDLLKLASRYNTTTLSAPLGWANATSLVPEPAALSVVAGLAMVGLRRRRLSGRLR